MQEELKTYFDTFSPLIKVILETYLPPNLFKKRNSESISSSTLTPKNFSEYISTTTRNIQTIKPLALPGIQKLLEEIYVPLTIYSTQSQSSIIIDKYPELLDQKDKILIVDTAGMGKSTLLKLLFLYCIKEIKGFPILIELRKLNRSNDVIAEIIKKISPINENIHEIDVLNIFKDGNFIFFLDGVDEIGLDDRSIVINKLNNFILKLPKNKFILSSRPDQILNSFNEFSEYHIAPLKEEESYQILKKYDNNGEISKSLINKLQSDDFLSVKEFLTNPLLTTLLFRAYSYKSVIPIKKSNFYRQVFDSLFERHDLSKGDRFVHERYSKLDVDDFDRVLRFIAFKSAFFLKKVEYTYEEMISLIEDAKSIFKYFQFQTREFFRDILTTVPLFIEDGQFYRWSHKSLQEYFAALYINDSREKNEILTKIFKSEYINDYLNIIDIYADIDFESYEEVFVIPILQDFMNYYYTGRHLLNDRIDEKLIKERLELTYLQFVSIRIFDEHSTDDYEEVEKFEKFAKKSINENLKNLCEKHAEVYFLDFNSEIILFDRYPYSLRKTMYRKLSELFTEEIYERLEGYDILFASLGLKTDKLYSFAYEGHWGKIENFNDGNYILKNLNLLKVNTESVEIYLQNVKSKKLNNFDYFNI